MTGECNYALEGGVFRRCGLAARSDLETTEWNDLFVYLEAIQSEFHCGFYM
jgi:hypothetical protein